MKTHVTVRSFLFTLTFLFLAGSGALAESRSPYLEPEEGTFGYREFRHPYHDIIADRLLTSVWDRKCQAVFLPSFRREGAVYIKYVHKDASTQPVVVSAIFEKQLWNEIYGWSESVAREKGQNVNVITHEAPINPEVAQALEKAWDAMLIRVMQPWTPCGGLDGETIHFANWKPGFGYQTGKIWSPKEGTPTFKLVRMAKALSEYPGLDEKEREAAAKDLLERAQDLLDFFERKE